MQILLRNIKEADCACDALILPLAEGGPDPYADLKPSVVRLLATLQKKEFKGRHNEVLLSPAPEDISPAWVLLVGLGKKEALHAEKVRQTGGKALTYLRDMGMKKAALSARVLETMDSHLSISSRVHSSACISSGNTGHRITKRLFLQ